MSTSNASEPDTGHDYDGIREFDNPLPGWWLTTLYATIVFSVGYWFYYQVFGAPGLRATLQSDEAEVARKMAASQPVSDDLLAKLSHDPQTVGKAQQTFVTQCAQCHGQKGEGKIGPNLTDDHFLHGKKPTEIYQTITNGYVKKGMPAWGVLLGPERVRGLASYVVSLQGKNLPGRAPEGEVIQ
jgi:cytochrome c oxidase cbb3-type subunit 3